MVIGRLQKEGGMVFVQAPFTECFLMLSVFDPFIFLASSDSMVKSSGDITARKAPDMGRVPQSVYFCCSRWKDTSASTTASAELH
ncbi:hypothetical protein RvY_07416 [Ramazzottius varieornatus]|uniref:Uncharacterized protein n=1 Tax=Ramazzottius varieornatus TaxID=947166 RepID=A0A1D1V4N3_RAMVA|nr:hypothetical protein RvY_07416 [Ramazzottius varieornatus]